MWACMYNVRPRVTDERNEPLLGSSLLGLCVGSKSEEKKGGSAGSPKSKRGKRGRRRLRSKPLLLLERQRTEKEKKERRAVGRRRKGRGFVASSLLPPSPFCSFHAPLTVSLPLRSFSSCE